MITTTYPHQTKPEFVGFIQGGEINPHMRLFASNNIDQTYEKYSALYGDITITYVQTDKSAIHLVGLINTIPDLYRITKYIINGDEFETQDVQRGFSNYAEKHIKSKLIRYEPKNKINYESDSDDEHKHKKKIRSDSDEEPNTRVFDKKSKKKVPIIDSDSDEESAPVNKKSKKKLVSPHISRSSSEDN